MIVKVARTMWLSNPLRALELDFEHGEVFAGQVHLTDVGIDMSNCGWVKLGTADVTMKVEVSSDKIAAGAIEALQQRLADADAEHQARRMVFLEAIGKLSSLGWSGGGS